jgi:hypothetical protein
MSETLAAWGGGSIAAGGGGMHAGVIALGTTAAGVVVVAGLTFYGSYRVYEWLSHTQLPQSEIKVLAMTSVTIRDAQARIYDALKAEAQQMAKKEEAQKAIIILRAQLWKAGMLYLCSSLVLIFCGVSFCKAG